MKKKSWEKLVFTSGWHWISEIINHYSSTTIYCTVKSNRTVLECQVWVQDKNKAVIRGYKYPLCIIMHWRQSETWTLTVSQVQKISSRCRVSGWISQICRARGSKMKLYYRNYVLHFAKATRLQITLNMVWGTAQINWVSKKINSHT